MCIIIEFLLYVPVGNMQQIDVGTKKGTKTLTNYNHAKMKI